MFLSLISRKVIMGIDNKEIKGTEIYRNFELGIKQIISELKLKNPKIEIKVYETEKIGVDYIVYIRTNNTNIRFHIQTETKSKNLNDITRSLLAMGIKDETRPYSYAKSEWVDYDLPVSKWISKFFHKRNMDMQNKLNYLIANRDIKFIGDWGISTPSANLFEILIKGAQYTGYPLYGEKIPILKIRHIINDLRAYSYIVLLEYSAFVFPDFCGPDSGEGGSAYEKVEKIIQEGIKKKKIIVYDLDISIDKFQEFAVKHISVDTFNSIPWVEYDKYLKIFEKNLNEKTFKGFELDNKIEKNKNLSQTSKKDEVARHQTINNYGHMFVNESITVGDISIDIENIKNKINSISIDDSIKIEIKEKLNEFNDEIKKPKPNTKKIKIIKKWFEEQKKKIPENVFSLTMNLITNYLKSLVGA